jgi:hypothetical protein
MANAGAQKCPPVEKSREAKMETRKRLIVALALYAVLGILIWTTMSDVPVKIPGGSISFRALPIAVLVIFGLRTVLHWKAEQIRDEQEKQAEGVKLRR